MCALRKYKSMIIEHNENNKKQIVNVTDVKNVNSKKKIQDLIE